VAVRRVQAAGGPYFGFHIAAPGPAWQRCIAELESRDTPGEGNGSVRPAEATADDWSLHDALLA
jgi:hypothetical protein